MLKVENVSKYYKDLCAVDHLSFEVEDQEIFGLLGSNGAGKTTTFRMIIGLLDKDSGDITLNGKHIDYNLREKIGFVTEERSLLTKLTVKEQVIYYGRLKGMKEKDILEKLDYWLDKFKITDYKDKKIKELSKGNQQKIQFISAVLNDPILLILDEPFTGLDPINVKQLKDAIYELKKNGCSIIFSSHQMEHIEEFCEKLVILVKGKPVIEGYLNKIKKDFRKKNVFIRGDIEKEDLLKVPGVLEVKKNKDEYAVKIESEDVVDKLFKKISKNKITKFVVEEPTLNEIFIDKVGEAYDE